MCVCRSVLEEAESELTGNISVEDVTVQNDGAADTVLRRMVFTSNRNLVQSEAVLCSPSGQATRGGSAVPAADRSTDAAVAGKALKGKKGKAKGKAAAKQKAKSGIAEGLSGEADGATSCPLAVDHSRLACDYHKGIVAGLSLIQPHLASISQQPSPQSHPEDAAQPPSQQHTNELPGQQSQQQPQAGEQPTSSSVAQQESPRLRPRAMVVGLGGGGLPVFLNRHCGMDVQSVELDPVVLHLACRHFGFTETPTLQVPLCTGSIALERQGGKASALERQQLALHALTLIMRTDGETHELARVNVIISLSPQLSLHLMSYLLTALLALCHVSWTQPWEAEHAVVGHYGLVDIRILLGMRDWTGVASNENTSRVCTPGYCGGWAGSSCSPSCQAQLALGFRVTALSQHRRGSTWHQCLRAQAAFGCAGCRRRVW